MVAWGKKDEQMIRKMRSGYPRFFIPHLVRKLAQELVDRAVSWGLIEQQGDGALALIFPHDHMAQACQDFLQSRSPSSREETRILIASFDAGIQVVQDTGCKTTQSCSHDRILIVTYPETLTQDAKAFWMHTGFGISSRCAEYWLASLSCLERVHCDNVPCQPPSLPHGEALAAKTRIRKRIAAQGSSALVTVQKADVSLFLTGMSAILHSGQLIRRNARAPPGATQFAVFGYVVRSPGARAVDMRIRQDQSSN
jgi:cystathionine gamma-synthase